MGLGTIFKFILLLPFKIILFPFKMLRRMFASRQTRYFMNTRDNLQREISKGERALDNKNLQERDRRLIQEKIKKARESVTTLEELHKKQRRLEADPDNRARFMAQKRKEWELRKQMGELKK